MSPMAGERILLRMDCNQVRAFTALVILLIVATVSASASQGRITAGRHEPHRPAAVRSAPADDGRRSF